MTERREDQDEQPEPEQTDSTAGTGSTANTAADVAAGRERDETPPEGEGESTREDKRDE
jgi:hypothetical protein